MINRDSNELRAIIWKALEYAKDVNWDVIDSLEGAEGVNREMAIICEAAIKNTAIGARHPPTY
jgi:hypothetical protein